VYINFKVINLITEYFIDNSLGLLARESHSVCVCVCVCVCVSRKMEENEHLKEAYIYIYVYKDNIKMK
jgi:hypothetical protein